MHGLSHLEHHVVRRVHYVRQGAHACCCEPSLDPDRRGSHGDAGDEPSQVAGAALEVEDVDRRHTFGRPLTFRHRRVRHRERDPGRGGHLARDTDNRQLVWSVRFDLEVEDRVVEPVERLDVGAQRGVGRQHQDAQMVVRDAELSRRTEHPLRLLSEQRPDRQRLGKYGHAGPRTGVRHEVPGPHVSHTHHHDPLDSASVDPSQAELLGIRMVSNLEHPGHQDPVQALPWTHDGFNMHPAEGEQVAEVLRRQLDRAEFAKPGQDDPHSLISVARTARGTERRSPRGGGCRGCRT